MNSQIPGMPPVVDAQSADLLNMPAEPQLTEPSVPAALAPTAPQAPLFESTPSGRLQTNIGGPQTFEMPAPVPNQAPAKPAAVTTADFEPPQTMSVASQPASTTPDEFKNIESQLIGASRAQQRVYDQMSKAEEAKAKASVAVHERQAQEAEVAQARLQDRYTEVDRAVSQQLTQLNDLRSFFLNEKYEPGKVDPNRANPFASDSVSRQLMAGLAVGLGGYSAGMLGGSNSALDIINKTIDRDIQAQRYNIEQKQKAFELGLEGKLQGARLTQDILTGLDKQFGNTMAAEDAYKVLRLEQASSALAQIGAKNDAVLKSGPYQLLKHQLDSKIAETKMQFAQMARNNAIKNVFGAAMDNPKAELPPSVLSSMPKEAREAYLESRERLVPLANEFAKDKQAAQKFAENAVPMITAKDNIRAVMAMAKDFNKVADLKQRELIQARLDAVLGQLRLAYTGPGAFTDSEKALVRNSVGDPTKLTDLLGVEPKKLEQTVKVLDNAIKRHAQTTFINPERALRTMDTAVRTGPGVTKRESK